MGIPNDSHQRHVMRTSHAHLEKLCRRQPATFFFFYEYNDALSTSGDMLCNYGLHTMHIWVKVQQTLCWHLRQHNAQKKIHLKFNSHFRHQRCRRCRRRTHEYGYVLELNECACVWVQHIVHPWTKNVRVTVAYANDPYVLSNTNECFRILLVVVATV